MKIALIGRPNVGKSTLFNRLTGRKAAIVNDQPGVTRDRRYGQVDLFGPLLNFIDTPGMEAPTDTEIKKGMWDQSVKALAECDLVLFVVDGRLGITPGDESIAMILRKSGKPLCLVVNKCESQHQQLLPIGEVYTLGLGHPVFLSAEHSVGMAELYEALGPHIKAWEETHFVEEPAVEEDPDDLKPLRLAIVGRPNAGKSTLVNKLIREERMLTGETPGLTRDAIEIEWSFEGKPLCLVDTAGLRKRAKVQETLEKLSAQDTLRTIQYAQVVVLMVDANSPLDKQDLQMARHVIDEGRCLVIAVNKWDTVKDPKDLLALIDRRLEQGMGYVRGIPVVCISSKTGFHLKDLMRQVFSIYDLWRTHIPTGQLNRWLEEATSSHPPPMIAHRSLKIKYATQIKDRPPTIALFANRADSVPETYIRYLIASLRKTFKLPGIPIRIVIKTSKNPYAT
jgi:GTP-binding protein